MKKPIHKTLKVAVAASLLAAPFSLVSAQGISIEGVPEISVKVPDPQKERPQPKAKPKEKEPKADRPAPKPKPERAERAPKRQPEKPQVQTPDPRKVVREVTERPMQNPKGNRNPAAEENARQREKAIADAAAARQAELERRMAQQRAQAAREVPKGKGKSAEKGAPKGNPNTAQTRPEAKGNRGTPKGEPVREIPVKQDMRPVAQEERPAPPTPQPEVAPVVRDREKEKAVAEAEARVSKEVNREKLAIKDPADARQMIQKIIGENSDLATTEQRRDLASRRGPDSSRDRDRDGRDRDRDDDRDRDRRDNDRDRDHDRDRHDASPRDAVVSYLLNRFLGRATLNDAPPEYRRGHHRGDGRHGDRYDRDRDEHLHHRHPVYQGRRHVRYRSRQDVPAILLAASVLNRVHVQNYNEVNYLPPRPESTGYQSDVPREYLQPDSYVVSYKVDPNSMISRDDILFQQGSTQFADQYSYQIVDELAAAMRDSSLANERFIIEGHASAEGGYESNLALSQRRAERIVRDIVRQGVSPERLIPVGYGESEASYPASAAESERRYDRKVVVFRMSE